MCAVAENILANLRVAPCDVFLGHGCCWDVLQVVLFSMHLHSQFLDKEDNNAQDSSDRRTLSPCQVPPCWWVPVHRFVETETEPVNHGQTVRLFLLRLILTTLFGQGSDSRFLNEVFCPSVFLSLPITFCLVHGLSYLSSDVGVGDHFTLDSGDRSRVELKVSARLDNIKAADDASRDGPGGWMLLHP